MQQRHHLVRWDDGDRGLGLLLCPNAVALVSISLEATHRHILQLRQPPPEVSVLLNDLPYNDFNAVGKSLAAFRQVDEPVVVTGVVPGSFYERLFPSGSVHICYSSNSLHWLSKGVIDKAKLDSFYILVYGPSDEDLREIIQEEAPFSITEDAGARPYKRHGQRAPHPKQDGE